MADFSITVRVRPPDALSPTHWRTLVIPRSLERIGIMLEGKAKDNITPFTRTGRLRSSVTYRVTGPTQVKIGTNVFYGPYVEYGTRPHVILPRKGHVLAWPVGGGTAAGLGHGRGGTAKRGGGTTAFATRVNHPGTKGRHYMLNTLNENKAAIVKIVRQEALAAIRGQ